jgi:hypothetical protein
MKYINLPKPHGFLIWRGKQTAIASPVALEADTKMLVVSNDEAYGEVTLSNPIACNLSEFERLEGEHRIRQEDRKLYWPDTSVFYVHRFKSWQPYEEYIEEKHLDSNGRECQMKRVLPKTPIRLNGDTAELLDLPEPNEAQKQLLEQAERLPKTILLSSAVTLEGDKAIIQNGIDPAKVQPILDATLSSADMGDTSLDLYQLALVRVPRFLLKKKEMTMPYKAVANHDECDDDKPVGIVNTETGKLKGCSEDMDMAKEAMAAMMANEGKSVKELLAEARKCYDEGMAMPMMMHGPVTFADLEALEEAREVADEAQELAYQFQMLSSNVLSNMDIKDKGAALTSLATEYSNRVQQIGKKELEGAKAKGGYLVSGDEGDHLPTTENGKVSHRLMGAAWASLHSGFRGNKYEGPNKSQAIAKLKKLYASEGMDTPDESDDKAGKRVKTSMKEKLNALWDTFKEFMDWANEADKDELPGFSKGFGIKQVNGIPWFIAYSTNAFEDREAEIFSTKSLEKYVEEADTKQDRGTFNFWHIPGTDFAQKEWQGVVGRFLVEAGPFLDNELGQSAYKFFNQFPDGHDDIAPEGWGCSPEYRYLPEERKSGVYQNIWITRTSVLPRLAAANIWTKGAIEMALSEQQKAAAVKIFGEDLTAKIVGQAEAATKDLEEAGVAHKEVTTEVQTEVEIPVSAIAQEVIKQLNLDFQPFSDALALIGQELVDLKAEMKSYEKQKQFESKVETPRYVFSLQQASKAVETLVPEGDPLKSKKPVETQPIQDNSGAAHFFPAR